MRYLTKSRFAIAMECPTKLKYRDDTDYYSTKLDNEFLAALAEGGHQVGALAKTLFPEGVEIDAPGHDAQVAQTAAKLRDERVVLFEPAIRVGGLFIRIDILRKADGVLELYEVKAKGFDPGSPEIIGARGDFLAGMKPYLYDIAFQRHVLGRAFPGVPIRSHLVMPDKTVRCDEDGASQRLRIVKRDGRVSVDIDASLLDGRIARDLLRIVPVDEYLDRIEREPLRLGQWEMGFSEGIDELERRLAGEFFPPRVGSPCKSCEFTLQAGAGDGAMRDGRRECFFAAFGDRFAASPGVTVFDLYASRRTDELIDQGALGLADLEPEDVALAEAPDSISSSHRQWLQAEEARGLIKRPYVRREPLVASIRSVEYPLHFIDFETSRPALPFHAGRRPYEQILFQFSHHRLDADGALRHQSQHLADERGGFPNFETLRELRRALATDGGTVIHWWDHERTVLREIRDQLDDVPADVVPDKLDLQAFIDSLLGTRDRPGRLLDLGRMVHRLVFLPGTRGSSSLKKVLPAMLGAMPSLRARYAKPTYGASGGIPSLNFVDHAWVRLDESGAVVDPYLLLGERCEDPDLIGLESLEEDDRAVANGGAAMVAYGLMQGQLLGTRERARLRAQLLRYCELDTLAMVMAWQGLEDLVGGLR